MNKYQIYKDICLSNILNKLNEYANSPVNNPIAEEQLRISLENTIKEEVEKIFDLGDKNGYKKQLSDGLARSRIKKFQSLHKMKHDLKMELKQQIYEKFMEELSGLDDEVLAQIDRKLKNYARKVEKNLEQ